MSETIVPSPDRKELLRSKVQDYLLGTLTVDLQSEFEALMREDSQFAHHVQTTRETNALLLQQLLQQKNGPNRRGRVFHARGRGPL